MKSPKLTLTDEGYYDWEISAGKSLWVEDGEQAAQHTLERLSQFYGELDSHPTLGTKVFEVLLSASKSRAEKEFEIRRIILGTEGNIGIEKLTWEQGTGDQKHTLTINAAIKHDWGTTDISETLTLL